MDHESLRTASTYLNNLLLSRGLLRDGTPIDFVRPSKDSRAQIINLVHDLILRADRDQAQRESAAESLRSLREDGHRHTHELERLRGRAEEAERRAVAAQNGERTAQAEVKKVERAMKTLQEQTARLKTALAQVKTGCANDVRKRDVELARLKTHLQGQQRGNRAGMTGPSLAARMPGTGAGTNPGQLQRGVEVADPAYSLRQETTEFLTQLSQSLSDENDGLIALVRGAMGTMRELLGLEGVDEEAAAAAETADNGARARGGADSAIGSLGSEDGGARATGKSLTSGNTSSILPASHDALSSELETTLSHLRELLTTPNYVSIEEVEAREDEIARLRAGWDRMELRWREVLDMMEGWRQRMDTGGAIHADEIRRGIGLVSPAPTRGGGDGVPSEGPEQSFLSVDVSEIRIDGGGGGGDDGEEGDGSLLRLLAPARGATGGASPKRKRDALEPPDFFDLRPPPSVSEGERTTTGSLQASGIPVPVPRTLADELEDRDESEEDLEVRRMTVVEKLGAAQAEAEEAAAAAGASARASALTASEGSGLLGVDGGAGGGGDDTLGKMPGPMVKRTRIRGRPRKRKSTLSPEELDALLAADTEG